MKALWPWLLLLLWARGGAAQTRLVPDITLTLEERYNDVPAGSAVPGGAAGQFFTRLTAQPGLSLQQPTLDLKAWYASDVLLRHGSGTMGWDHRGEVTLRKEVNRRLRLDAAARVWRVTDPTSLPRLGVALAWAPIVYGRVDVAARYEGSSRFRYTVGHRFEGAQLLGPGELPGFYHAPFLLMEWVKSRRTTLGVEGRVQLFLEGPARAYSQGVALSAYHLLTKRLRVSAEAGPVYYVDALSPSGRGWLPRFSGEITHGWQRAELSFSAGQDLVGASGFSTALWAQYVLLNLSFVVSRDLTFSTAASYFRNDSATEVMAGALTGDLSEGYLAGLRLEWRLLPVLSAVATLDRFEELGVLDAGAGFSMNFGGIRLVYSPGRAF